MIVAIVGMPGSGKSVTSRTLVGLAGANAIISADRLTFAGEDLRSYPERRWRELRGGRIGFVMQDALGSLDPLRTVGAEIAESLRLHTPLNREQRAAKVIALLRSADVPEPEVRARQYPHQLSGGLRQRALIASAIACGETSWRRGNWVRLRFSRSKSCSYSAIITFIFYTLTYLNLP